MQKEEDRINRMDLLLMLLLADGQSGRINEPIEGNTRLQKELFLSQKKLREFGVERPYSFRPYHYGPYSKEIYNDIDWLKRKGIIEESSTYNQFGGIVRKLALTTRGIQKTKNMIKERALHDQYKIIKDVKRKFNDMSVVELVEFTHREYSDYAGNAYQH